MIIRLNIDGKEIKGNRGQTILEVALENDVPIPTLCYDKRMPHNGSCSICFVEALGMPKLLRACATEIAEGMVIKTDTPRVRESRKVNLELLLSQHIGDCIAPCVIGCPAHTDCQGYVGLIANGQLGEAHKLIKSKIPLAASIGRVCPHPCQDACRRKLVEEPVSILNLKRYAADIDLSKPEPYLPPIAPASGKRVGIIGGGPGGLSCAYFLAEKGHSVTVYDAMPNMGGMLRYGIPEYRLPNMVIDKETALIEKMGVLFKNNVRIGEDISFGRLKKLHDAVVIAIGAWKSMPLRCPGEDLPGVYGGIEFLRKIYDNEASTVLKNVAVIGGGNTAMDACRTAVRLGAENVYLIYRRTKAEMPAAEIEIIEAEEEGVIFKYLVAPIEVIAENGKTAKLRLQKMRLGEPDNSGRRRPEPIEGEEEEIAVDTVITALGQGIAPGTLAEIELTKWNTIIADEEVFTTNIKGIFAIGDCINDGASIAIKAVADARLAAVAVDGYLHGIEVSHKVPYRVTREDLTEDDFADIKKEPRSHAHHLSPEQRRSHFLEVMETFDLEAALSDASRCLECGCHDYFECKLISLADQYDVQPDRFKESVKEVVFDDDHPYILRDPNKCILCGLCVRVCEELVGACALGFVGRGFETTVMPTFEKPLSDAGCVSCGECISVCPTGALQERITFKKSVPLNTKKTASLCGICAVGCSVDVESYGNLLVRNTPSTDRGVNNGMMCAFGRFGINYVQKEGRIDLPLIRKDGELRQVSWYDAFIFTAMKMRSLKMRGLKTAVSIGHSYSVEDAGALVNLAAFLGAEAFSFTNRVNGLAKVLGYDGSPNTFDEVVGCDCIVVLGNLMLKNPVIVSKLREAVRNGASVTVISADMDDFNLPCKVVKVSNSTAFLKEITKALIDAGCSPMNVNGFNGLKAALSDVVASDDAKALAEGYMAAKNAMVLFPIFELSEAAMIEVANMAVIAGHIGKPRNGIYMLRQLAGSQVLADLGITGCADIAMGASGLMVFGEDVEISKEILDNLEFLAVQDTHLTETGKLADVVFPMKAFPELCATFVNTERRLLRSCKAVDSPVEYSTAEIAQRLAEVLEGSIHVGSVVALYRDTEIGGCYPSPVLCSDGFGFPDNNARLLDVGVAEMFVSGKSSSFFVNAVYGDLN